MKRHLKKATSLANNGLISGLKLVGKLDKPKFFEKQIDGGALGKLLSSAHRKKLLEVIAEGQGNRQKAISILLSSFDGLDLPEEKLRDAQFRIARHIARLEFQIRCITELDPESLAELDLPAFDAEDAQSAKVFLEGFWSETVPALEPGEAEALGRAYRARALRFRNNGRTDLAVTLLEPMVTQFPEGQEVQRVAYELMLSQAVNGDPVNLQILEQWWAWYEEHIDLVPKKTKRAIWKITEKTAKVLAKEERYKEAESLILPSFKYWPEETEALTILARGAQENADWDLAAQYWQLYAAIQNPVTTKSRTHVAKNVAVRKRRTKFALTGLRNARLQQATALAGAGKTRAFGELVSRILESVPDHRVFKNDRQIIDVVRTYIQQSLADDGFSVDFSPLEDGKPLRIAFCMDILKISDVHVHSRLIFRICRNLLEWNDQIETHIIVTNERFAVTTPVVNMSFSPTKRQGLFDTIREALPEFYGSRCHLHYSHGLGLEGLIDTCKSIHDLKPDVMLFAGGHKGLFSNESRVVRHCLYDSFPCGFFFMQSNNEVDEKLDLIIARGPHEIEGEPGDAKVRIQPYPTLIDDSGTDGVVIDVTKVERKIIVSAISGVRMDVRMNEMPVEDLQEMLSLLDKVPGAVWHLIGSENPKKLIKKNSEVRQRVEAGQMVVHSVMQYDEFIEFVSNASLFYHPPGFTGGSGGSSVARKAGVPIITFSHSDVSGRQPPETVFENEHLSESLEFAQRLLTDPECWETTVKAQVAHTTWIRETSVEGFYDCLCETLETGRTRIEAGPQGAHTPDGHHV